MKDQIVYIVSYSVKIESKNESGSIPMETICIYNKLDRNWEYLEYNNNAFTQEVLSKMFTPSAVNKVLDFESNK